MKSAEPVGKFVLWLPPVADYIAGPQLSLLGTSVALLHPWNVVEKHYLSTT